MSAISKNFKSAAVGTVFGGSLLVSAGLGMAGIANAEPMPAPQPGQDGLVTVMQGETTLLDGVVVAEATNTVSQICGPAVLDPSALVSQVDSQGVSAVACAGLPAGDVVVAQNVSTSPVVPGTAAETAVDPAAEPAAPVPAGSEESATGDVDGAGAAEAPPVEEEEPSTPAVEEGIGATWDPI